MLFELSSYNCQFGSAKWDQFQALQCQMTLKMYVKVTHNLIRFEPLLDAYSVRICSGFAKYL